MRVIRNPQKLNRILKSLRNKYKSVGFVPTMGALHPGHLSLIKQAKKENEIVVVSIFVNPKQFGSREDLNRYPRPLKNDFLLCRKENVDLVFLPNPKSMYPEGFSTFVNVEGLSNLLCGATRPGHFRGVATVVAKLLNIIAPDVLYLGQKDAQQVVIIQRMVSDLNFSVKLRVMPTVRLESGLAMSSRNEYLGQQERKDALVLSRALDLAKVLIKGGAKDTVRIMSRLRQLIDKYKSAKIDYIAVVDLVSLKPLKRVSGDCLVVLAVYIGKTRLIDNIIVR